jgi:hypothetical protein
MKLRHSLYARPVIVRGKQCTEKRARSNASARRPMALGGSQAHVRRFLGCRLLANMTEQHFQHNCNRALLAPYCLSLFAPRIVTSSPDLMSLACLRLPQSDALHSRTSQRWYKWLKLLELAIAAALPVVTGWAAQCG